MSLKEKLIQQFHHPKGPLGLVAGQIMARRESNLARNRWTVDLLELTGYEHVLELGPGPGVTLNYLLSQLPNGLVVGLDHSSSMLKQAKRRNRRAISAGKLTLREADFTRLPALPGPFDRILAVNSLQFDGAQRKTLEAITSHLAAQGQMAVTFQPRGEHPTDTKALRFAEKVAGFMEDVGLVDLRIEKLPMQPACAMCVLGKKYT